MHKPLISLLASAILLAGCSLAPEYREPAGSLPASFDNAAVSAQWPAADWWQAFGSAELAALVARAEQGNLDLALAMSRVRQADLQARIAGAPLLPSVSADLGGRRAYYADDAGGGHGDGYSAGLSISYELDLWGKNRNSLASSELAAQASAFDRDGVYLTLSAGVASSYFKVLELRERERIAGENLASAEEVLKVAEAKTRLGASSELDLLQQRTVVEQRRATLPALRQQRMNAENALAVLLGEAPQQFAATLADESLGQLREPQFASGGLPSELLLRRPDIRSQEALLRAANADIGVARAALFPSLSLSGSSGYDADVFSQLFSAGNLAHGVSASLLQPIFRGGALRGAVALSEERYVALADGYRLGVLTALQEVEDALIAVREGARQREIQARVVDNAERAFRLAELQYRTGAEDILSVLSAQQTYFSARDALLQSHASQLQNHVQLYKVLGGGFGAAQG